MQYSKKSLKKGPKNVDFTIILLATSYAVITRQHMGTAVAQWLRYCATNWKVDGSIPDGVIGIFH
jgi:hypothetical protein